MTNKTDVQKLTEGIKKGTGEGKDEEDGVKQRSTEKIRQQNCWCFPVKHL